MSVFTSFGDPFVLWLIAGTVLIIAALTYSELVIPRRVKHPTNNATTDPHTSSEDPEEGER